MARLPHAPAPVAGCTPDRREVIAGLAAAGAAAAMAGRASQATAQDVEVDLALVLAVDCSWSVDTHEFRLQMLGHAEAFRRPEIHRAIAGGPVGRIAVASVQWSREDNQSLAVPWTVVGGSGDAAGFAGVLETTKRDITDGATAIGAAMTYCAGLLREVPLSAARKVIDISCDGRSNRGLRPWMARDRIVAEGMTINGLVILDEWPTLDIYFQRQVVGGPDHFVVVAHDYAAYGQAIYRKLLQEITGPGMS